MTTGDNGTRDGGLPDQAPTVVARLLGDRATILQAFSALSERDDTAGIASTLFEQPDGQWALALHFTEAPNQTAVRALVALAAGAEAANALAFETVAPRSWVAASLAGLSPVAAGRFRVHGAHDRGRTAPNNIGIEIEAGLAFGTGHHATTLGCLIALHGLAKRSRRANRISRHTDRRQAGGAAVLDVGTGTGVLAIAAAMALHRPVVASDVDATAIRVARANARLNRVGTVIAFVVADGLRRSQFRMHGPYGLVLANVLLAPLRDMATAIARHTAPGGRVVLSGLLASQARTAVAVYRDRGLVLERRLGLDGWVTLTLVRPANKRRP